MPTDPSQDLSSLQSNSRTAPRPPIGTSGQIPTEFGRQNGESPIHMAGPSITEHEVKVVLDALRNGWYEKAYHYVETFEAGFAAFHQRRYALMTPSCTTAIHLLLTALGLSEGDEVMVPECTWIASSAPISYLGARPVFCDIDPVNWCLDPESVKRNLSPKTRALIVVDLFGNMPHMDDLQEIADQHGLYLVEDAAEALGSIYRGTRAGKFGVGSVFSFHRTKTLTTGEGGMLLLDDEQLYERCRFLRDHGRKSDGPTYYNYEVTYKYMPFNLQAALGWAQFQRLEELVTLKRDIWKQYQRRLADLEDIQLNPEPDGVFNSVWITALVFGHSLSLSKLEAIQGLGALGLPARPFFYPLSSLPAYGSQEKVYRDRNPRAYDISARGINLPGALNLTESQIDRVCDGLRSIIAKTG